MKRAAIGAIRMGGHALMSPLERTLMHGTDQPQPPVFVIGAPRSGTSLLYELMITRFRFAYMANAAHRFYRTPLAATRLLRKTILDWRGDFTSSYGHIDGWGAPNEGGWIWQRWLPDGDRTDGAEFAHSSIEELRSLTAGFSRELDAPFLNKNVMHSNRLRLMHRIWPDALFIEVRRDPLDNARSILRAERASGGPDVHGDGWWSVRPSLAAEHAGKADTLRAVAQVVGVARDIERDMEAIGPGRLLRIDYTDICVDPPAALGTIRGFLEAHGCKPAERLAVPESFGARPSNPLGDDDEAALAAALNRLGPA
ncbi:MAG: sulfotransferase family protein [Erythrobacter sp.]